MHTTQTERQALDAAINRTTRRKTRKESTALPYPELPDADQPQALFWLAAWLRAQKECEEYNAFAMARWLSHSPALASGLVNAHSHLQDRAEERLTNLIRHGGLLFAWHGTTALSGVEVEQ